MTLRINEPGEWKIDLTKGNDRAIGFERRPKEPKIAYKEKPYSDNALKNKRNKDELERELVSTLAEDEAEAFIEKHSNTPEFLLDVAHRISKKVYNRNNEDLFN